MAYDPLGLSNIFLQVVLEEARKRQQQTMPAGVTFGGNKPTPSLNIKQASGSGAAPKAASKTVERITSSAMPTIRSAGDLPKNGVRDSDEEIDAWLSFRISDPEAGDEPTFISAGASTADGEKSTAKQKTKQHKAGYVYNKATGKYMTREQARGWAKMILRQQGRLIEGTSSTGSEKKTEDKKEETPAPQPSAPKKPSNIGDPQQFSAAPPAGGTNEAVAYFSPQVETGAKPEVSAQDYFIGLGSTPDVKAKKMEGSATQKKPATPNIAADYFSNMYMNQMPQPTVAQDEGLKMRNIVARLASNGVNVNSPTTQQIAQRLMALQPQTLELLSDAVAKYAKNSQEAEEYYAALLDIMGA